MKRNKSSVSKAASYREIGDHWDVHDLAEVWGKTKKVKFEVQIESEATYYPIEKNLSERIQKVARKQEVSSNTLVNLWIQQKLQEKHPQQICRSGLEISSPPHACFPPCPPSFDPEGGGRHHSGP